MNVNVRPASHPDADALAKVHVASWRSGYAGLLPSEYLANLDVSARADRWREILAGDGGSTLVAELAGQIVGFVSIGADRTQRASSVGELYAIYVETEHWGQGIGHDLHESGLDALRDQGCTTAQLWVLRGNRRAISFYREHGWRFDGRNQIDRHLADIELDEIGFSRPL